MNLTSTSYLFLRGTIIFVLFSYFETISAQIFQPGVTYYDSTGFVEYLAGDLPIIISVPHGGYLEPDSIPDRNCTGCSYLRDSYTQEIGRGVIDAFYQETGCYPHMIINLLHRKKFDANRDIGDAADGNPLIEKAWYNYHEFIDSSKTSIIQGYGRGLFLDLHGHAHTIQRIELGYLLSGSELRLSNVDLNTTTYIEESSLRTLVSDNIQNHTHSELIRGDQSLGTILDDKGFPSVPSFSDPFPDVGEPYFSGGYNTVRHGSRDNNGDIDGIQIECNSDVRFDTTLREKLIDSLVTAVNQYFHYHYNDQYLNNYCKLVIPVELIKFNAQIRGNSIVLDWATLTETDNDYFEIQRSVDGIVFEKIGQLKGAGSSAILNEYKFVDENPIPARINYYRLKQVDFDGKFEYSTVIGIDWKHHKKAPIKLYPNPSFTGLFTLDFSSNMAEDLVISIYDVTAKIISSETHQVMQGHNSLKLNYAWLHKGIYFIKIEAQKGFIYQKLIIN